MSNLDKWVAFLGQAEIPVLRSSVDELARLKQNEDNITARDISGVILRDPMLTVRVLRYLQEYRRNSRGTEITTVGHAVMMLGITPFFRQFRDMKVVEEVLADRPHALQGFMAVISRAHYAALYARDWAALCYDIESDEIVIAALLYDVAEMLLWCLAPEFATGISERMQHDRTLRSAAAQEGAFGFRLIDVQLTLVKQWHLPALLQALMDDTHATQPRAHIVALAVALARHSAHGWDDAALPDDYVAIRKFLGLSLHEVVERIQRVVVRAVRGPDCHGTGHPVAWPPSLSAAWSDAEKNADDGYAGLQAAALRKVAERLAARAAASLDWPEMIALVLDGMHAGLGLGRVLFMDINEERGRAAARYVIGSGQASGLRYLKIDLTRPHVFSRVVNEGGGIWHDAAARNESPPAVPEEISRVIGDNEFFAMAIPVNGKPIGLIYADSG
ncbi:MAG: hypothetical protein A2143_05245, partial [Gallionellales bacterium RBG_16_57_15]